jgi:mannose-6-phosphate isomerase-like protein (cupin superfamily)
MMLFTTSQLGEAPDQVAPDGSEVRRLASGSNGSMAHFRLSPRAVSRPVAHRSVEELWFVVSGSGRLWRSSTQVEETVELRPGTSMSIPAGTTFQFRADGEEPLEVVGVTMPPWPGNEEAEARTGIWVSTL